MFSIEKKQSLSVSVALKKKLSLYFFFLNPNNQTREARSFFRSINSYSLAFQIQKFHNRLIFFFIIVLSLSSIRCSLLTFSGADTGDYSFFTLWQVHWIYKSTNLLCFLIFVTSKASSTVQQNSVALELWLLLLFTFFGLY